MQPTDTHFPGLTAMRIRATRRRRVTYAALAAIVALVGAAILALLYVIAWAASLWGSSIGDQFTRARDSTLNRPVRHILVAPDWRLR